MQDNKSHNHDQFLTKDELSVVSICKIIGSIFSLLGTSFIIIIYIYLRIKTRNDSHRDSVASQKGKDSKNDEKNYKQLKMGYGHNLIFLLSISDFVYSWATFIKLGGFSESETDTGRIDASCVAQGFLINFSELSSICWTSMISLLIYLGTFADITKISKIYWYFSLYSYGLPSILSFGPLITKSYGPAGAWCWMNTQNLAQSDAWIWALIIYIFSWVNIIFNFFAVYKAIRYFEIRAFEIKEENHKEYNFLKNFCIVLKFFPMILIICWFFPTINRIYTFISHKQNVVLFSLHILFTSMTGFFNTLVYSYYYKSFIPCLNCLFGSEKEVKTNEKNEIQEMKTANIPEKVNEDYIQNVTEKDPSKFENPDYLNNI